MLPSHRIHNNVSFPDPLRGPEFGSYAADEVAWLLTDLSAHQLEAPTVERERAVQSGLRHYAESLPIEFRPSAEYDRLFHEAVARSSARVARAVGVVTELTLAGSGPEPVLVSLARAGTPIGILMRRWALQMRGLDLPHYTVSIVRGRGIDRVALGYLAARHDPRAIAFVDGWTGKGAIARELTAAIEEINESSLVPPFSSQLAVLADPGRCVPVFGTRDDFLIPSACLNSTVSGLVSRTVLNADLIGPGDYHGAKFYRELADADVSGLFLDAVSARFDEVATEVATDVSTAVTSDRRPTWAGWAEVSELSARFGLRDLNLIKPGVGETTRVLLRRQPWRVLVRPDAVGDLAHVLLLAEERGVEVVPTPGLTYSCVGLIRPSSAGEPA